MIPYETLLDAARRHFEAVSRSPNYTREARNKAAQLARDAAAEMANRADTEAEAEAALAA